MRQLLISASNFRATAQKASHFIKSYKIPHTDGISLKYLNNSETP